MSQESAGGSGKGSCNLPVQLGPIHEVEACPVPDDAASGAELYLHLDVPRMRPVGKAFLMPSADNILHSRPLREDQVRVQVISV